jgi:hypothetical protein
VDLLVDLLHFRARPVRLPHCPGIKPEATLRSENNFKNCFPTSYFLHK